MNPAMYMLLYSCKNHPQVKTKRRCRSCARPICSACIYKANRHLFCSNKCHKKYHFITLPKLAGKHLLRKWKALPRGISVRSAITSATILALSGYMIFALIHIKRLESRVTALSYQLALLADTTQAKQKGNASPAKNTETPVVLADNGVMINEQTLNIAGQAKQHSMATLTLGDKMQQSQMITDGSFAFSNLPFPPPGQQYLLRAIDPAKSFAALGDFDAPATPSLSTRLVHDFSRGPATSKAVALTFDGGALANAVAPILAVIAQKNVRATMFLTGKFIETHAQATFDIWQAGHEIGNHSWDHPHLTRYAINRTQQTLPHVDRSFLQQQLTATSEAFSALTGAQMRPFWRAPYGEHNQELREWAAELGYRHVGWTSGQHASESLDTMDWVADSTSAAYHSSEEILQRLVTIAAQQDSSGLAGGIILMHLGTLRDHDPAYQALPALIDKLRGYTYRFVTISELIRATERQ